MNRLLKLVGGALAGAGALVLAARGITYATEVEPAEIEIARVNIPLRHLPAAFNGLTIAHLSDMHLGGWMTVERMQQVAALVNDLQPDVVALTGDFVHDLANVSRDGIIASLNTVRAKEQIVGVFGNHDHRHGAARVSAAVREAGVTLLFNEHIVLTRGAATLYIAGVDDIWIGRQDLPRALDGIPRDSAVVLLAHEPDFADSPAASGRVGLQLSGHTHGGQIRLPVIGAPVLPRLGQKYDAGLFRVEGMALYVNRGVGMIPPYVRVNCRPEITLLTLTGD
jgi:uncharacterized protein